jgi:nucleoside-diphosphate-sugar epimerase
VVKIKKNYENYTFLTAAEQHKEPNPVNHYAASKCSMEIMARNYLSALPIFFVRPFNYTGVGQADNFVIPKIVSHFINKPTSIELGNMDVEREFNDVRFVCDAYLKLLTNATTGEAHNICTGQPMALVNVIDALSALTGHTINVNINPLFVRKNEIKRLCGSPLKLHSCVGSLKSYSLLETLRWMLHVPS